VVAGKAAKGIKEPFHCFYGPCVPLSLGPPAEMSWVRVPALPPFYCVATLGKLFTHIASPVFSHPRNWVQQGSIRTGPI